MATSILAPLMLFVGASWYDLQQVKAAGTRQAVATADALAEHAQKVIETSQLVLSLVADQVSEDGWSRVHDDAKLHSLTIRLASALPQIRSIFLVSPEGLIAASSRAFPMPPLDVHDREYVRVARAGDGGVHVSAPFRSVNDDTKAFTVTRPLDPLRPVGGLVGVTLSPDYFEHFYGGLVDGSVHARASLLRSDGTVLVRFPGGAGLPSVADAQDLVSPARIAATPAGTIEGTSRSSGRTRLAAYHALSGVPLVALYSVDARGMLGEWYRHMAVLAGFAVVLATVLAYSTRAAIQRTGEERQSLRLLVAETTRREQAEDALRQLQKIDALGRLTGGVAHDFNNLLTAVMGSLELALRRVDEPRVTRLLTGAMEASRRGARLTQQMLAFSRQQNVQMRAVGVNEALRAMSEMLQRALGPEIRVAQVLADDLWPAMADVAQLEAAILNIGINARDAMPDGGDLRIATVNLRDGDARPAGAPAGDLVVVTVADTGTGMTDEVMRRAVEPFYTTKDVGRGTGLGLSMVHGFALHTGGGLILDSVPGQGTTVRLCLPRSLDAPVLTVEAVPRIARQPPRLILVVDDDDAVRTLSAEMLRELGHSVVEVADGSAALIALQATPRIELMVIDYAMPVMNGGELARRAAQIRPDMKMVFVTGYAERTALQEWTSRGYPLVPKPFTLPQLSDAIGASTAMPRDVLTASR